MRMTSNQAWVLALTSSGSFMIALDSTVVTTAPSTIRRDRGASVATLEWTVNAYVLSFALLLMTGAALGDRFGRRRMFVAGLALFTAASAARGRPRGAGAGGRSHNRKPVSQARFCQAGKAQSPGQPAGTDQQFTEVIMSKTVIVRYQTRPDAADENQRLVQQVFAQLAEDDPGGLRYATFRLADGVTFVHVATVEGDVNPLSKVSAFAEFQREIGDRVEAPPQAADATLVGSYRWPV